MISIEGFDATSSKPPTDVSAKSSSSDTIVLRSASELLATSERESAGRLKLLNEVHRALATSLSLEELLEQVLDRTFVHLGPEEAVIFLKKPHGGLERTPRSWRAGADVSPCQPSTPVAHTLSPRLLPSS